jgi:hypothetical protein
VLEVFQADQAQVLAGAGQSLGAWHRLNLERELNVVEDGPPRQRAE